jgi:hypothetical protein
MPAGTADFDQSFSGEDKDGDPVKLSATRVLEADQEVDLTPDIKANYDYFESGPGYKALETE